MEGTREAMSPPSFARLAATAAYLFFGSVMPTYLVLRSAPDAANWFTKFGPVLATAIGVVVVAGLFVEQSRLRLILWGLGSIILIGAGFVASRSAEADTLIIFFVPTLLVIGTAALLLVAHRPRAYTWSLLGLFAVVTIGVGIARLVVQQTGAADAALVSQALISSFFFVGWLVPLMATLGRGPIVITARHALAASVASCCVFLLFTWWAWLEVASIPLAAIAVALAAFEAIASVLLGRSVRGNNHIAGFGARPLSR
jgi:hypothetical protein